MTPSHRDFENFQSRPRRKEQQFGIEAEAGDRHLLEYCARLCSPEEFEAALGIVNSQSKDCFDDQVEDDPAKLTSPRLMFFDKRAIDGPGSDDDTNLTHAV